VCLLIGVKTFYFDYVFTFWFFESYSVMLLKTYPLLYYCLVESENHARLK